MRGGGCVGVLLAGGASSRFGGHPKGLARLDGARIADRVLAALAPATTRILIVANDERAAAWFPDHAIIRDAMPGLGPLAGLVAALDAANGAPVLVAAWDMPFLTPAVMAAIRGAAEASVLSMAPMHGRPPIVEPLCACYLPEAGAVARELLAGGARRAGALHEALAAMGMAGVVREEVLRPHGDPARLFTSVDTYAALERLGGTRPTDADVMAPRR